MGRPPGSEDSKTSPVTRWVWFSIAVHDIHPSDIRYEVGASEWFLAFGEVRRWCVSSAFEKFHEKRGYR
jgi:hypothetical protein